MSSGVQYLLFAASALYGSCWYTPTERVSSLQRGHQKRRGCQVSRASLSNELIISTLTLTIRKGSIKFEFYAEQVGEYEYKWGIRDSLVDACWWLLNDLAGAAGSSNNICSRQVSVLQGGLDPSQPTYLRFWGWMIFLKKNWTFWYEWSEIILFAP